MLGIGDIVKQAKAADELLERAARAVAKTRGLRGGDRVYDPLITEAVFQQGSAAHQDLVFSAPADSDFWGYRLLLFPQCRIITVDGTADEVVFRPTSFSMQSSAPGITNPAQRYSDFNNLVDATFALIFEGRELHNVDAPVAATYCANVGKWQVDVFGGVTSMWCGAIPTPGGLVFDIPFFIPRTKSVTCRVTPTHLATRTIDARRHEYRIVGVFEGEKKAGAFR